MRRTSSVNILFGRRAPNRLGQLRYVYYFIEDVKSSIDFKESDIMLKRESHISFIPCSISNPACAITSKEKPVRSHKTPGDPTGNPNQ